MKNHKATRIYKFLKFQKVNFITSEPCFFLSPPIGIQLIRALPQRINFLLHQLKRMLQRETTK